MSFQHSMDILGKKGKANNKWSILQSIEQGKDNKTQGNENWEKTKHAQ